MAEQPLVGVIMGSDSDWSVMSAAADALDEFDVRARGAGRLRAPHAARRWPTTRSRRPSAGCG